MNPLLKGLTLLLLLIAVGSIGLAQSTAEMKASGDAERAARKAYEARAYGEFLTEMRKANAARPNHPRIIYNLAAAYSINGKPDDAIRTLQRLVNMGLVYAFEKDADFGSLASSLKFEKINRQATENRRAINASARVLSIPDKTLIAESIAFDPKDRSYFVSSVHQRKIVKIHSNGTVTDFSNVGDGMYSVLGLKIDASRGWLWAATTAFPRMKGFAVEDKGRSAIAKYDLITGKLIKKYLLPSDADHGIGDIVIAKHGTIYASDSVNKAIYKIDATSDELTEFLRSDLFASLQGIDLGEDRNTLFVADYSKGIFRIDLATRSITQLRPSEEITLLGIDGLYFYRGRLIAIQNGVSPNRVVSFQIDGDRISAFKTLEANHPDFIEPTTGVIVGDEFIYVANSQWPFVNEKAELATDKLREPVILKLDLRKAIE